MYSLLSEVDIERMKVHVLELIGNENLEVAKEILIAIVCYRNISIHDCLVMLMKNNEYYPAIIFNNASADISEYLISKLNEEAQSVNLNHILSALVGLVIKML